MVGLVFIGFLGAGRRALDQRNGVGGFQLNTSVCLLRSSAGGAARANVLSCSGAERLPIENSKTESGSGARDAGRAR